MRISRWLALISLGFASSWLAADGDAHEGDFASDRFAFGGSVRIEQPVPGDLIAAGGNVDLDAAVRGDAVAAGGNLRLSAAVGQNVYAAGGRLVIDGPVGRNLRIAGGQVELGPRSSVGGNITVAGGTVSLRGTVKGAVRASGGRVTIDGAVDGDVESNAGTLRLGPNARIGGQLRYRSGAALVSDPAAQVTGGIERQRLPGQDRAATADRPERKRWSGTGWIWSLGLMALAALLVTALPGLSRRVAEAWRTRFGWSLLWGFIALVCIPAAVLILLLSVIGIPIALLTALLYGALLIVGYAASGIALGLWGLVRWRPERQAHTGWRIGSVVLAVLALALLGSVPFVGGPLGFVAVITGIGAIAQLVPATRRLTAA